MSVQPVTVRLHVSTLTPGEAAARFGGMLAPSLAYRQRTGPLADGLVAVVAARGGQRLGVALGQVRPGTDVGEVLCLAVDAGERRRGVGSALLARLGVALARAGCRVVQGTVRSDWAGADAALALLASAGWGAPVVQKLFYKVDLRAFDALPEIRALALPEGYAVDGWDSLTAADRARVEAVVARDPRARPVDPFQRPDLVSRDFSVWVRHAGEVVGWMMLMQPSPAVMEYGGLYVERAHRPSRAGVAAVAAAVRRQVAAIDRYEASGGDPQGGPPRSGVFAVEPWNGEMRAFARRWIGLPEATVTTVWLSGTALAPAGTPAGTPAGR